MSLAWQDFNAEPTCFGGALGQDHYHLMPELSVAYLLRKDLAIGAEVRFKPNKLEPAGNAVFGANSGALREDSWKDLFIAWAPGKQFSLTLAYVDLGRIAPALVSGRKQTGAYQPTSPAALHFILQLKDVLSRCGT